MCLSMHVFMRPADLFLAVVSASVSTPDELKREFGKYNGNVSKDVLINNSIYTQRQRRP